MIAAGCFVLAFGFHMFTNPNHIVAGGVVGLSTVLQGAFGWNPATFQAAINIPLLIFGWIMLGKQEGFRSLLGSILLPVAIGLVHGVPALTDDPLLGALFGGAIFGVGLALILGARGSVGGYTLIARVLAKRFSFSVPTTLLALDGLTIIGSSWQFGTERALLGLVAAYVMRTAIDRMLVGFRRAFVALVISKQHVLLRERVLFDLERGLTIMNATGGYTSDERPVLMVVLSGAEVPRLRAIVSECDPDAFVVITDATEVLGEGFVRA